MMVAAERAPWQNPRILSTLMLVFLAGAAVGALSMRFGVHDWLHQPQRCRRATGDARCGTQPLSKQLDLDSAQTAKLALVLDDYRQYYRACRSNWTISAPPARRELCRS